MTRILDIVNKILTNILTALYQPFGFSLLLSFFAMFFYLYAYHPTNAGKGWKISETVCISVRDEHDLVPDIAESKPVDESVV